MTYRIIGNERERGICWAAPILETTPEDWDRASCLILEKNGDITAVAVYNNWRHSNSVEISIASVGRNWLTRPFLAAVFAAPFIEWNMRRVSSSIAANNAKSIRFCEHLGFTREGTIREGHCSGDDLLIYGLLKRECRFLPGAKYDVKRQRTSGAGSKRGVSRSNAIQ